MKYSTDCMTSAEVTRALARPHGKIPAGEVVDSMGAIARPLKNRFASVLLLEFSLYMNPL